MKTKTKEQVQFVDATPDDEYPIRILMAHFANNSNSYWSADGNPGLQSAVDELNRLQQERIWILQQAIDALRKTKYIPRLE